jgi:nucleoside-diphosphate-sugar epimerase
MRTAYITGASGFCGRALTKFLADQGVSVIPIYREDFNQDGDRLAVIIKKHKPDWVFHLAGTSHTTNKLHLYTGNLLTATQLIEALDAASLKPIVIFVGSAAEYGLPQTSDNIVGEKHPEVPLDFYGASKLAQTNFARMLISHGWPIVITRPFNVLGKGMPSKLALGSFLRQFRDGSSGALQLQCGDLTAERDFVLVDDLVKSWWGLANCENAIGQIVNICSGTAIPLLTLVNQIAIASNRTYTCKKSPHGLTGSLCQKIIGANELHQKILGWSPRVIDANDICNLVKEFNSA